jgi:hypothetical protein
MDYNHDCKKMFTQGQADRMTAALNLPSRITLWSESNLEATGCVAPAGLLENSAENSVLVYPNPTHDVVYFKFDQVPVQLTIYDAHGKLVLHRFVNNKDFKINTSELGKGLYIYHSAFENKITRGKFIIK